MQGLSNLPDHLILLVAMGVHVLLFIVFDSLFSYLYVVVSESNKTSVNKTRVHVYHTPLNRLFGLVLAKIIRSSYFNKIPGFAFATPLGSIPQFRISGHGLIF